MKRRLIALFLFVFLLTSIHLFLQISSSAAGLFKEKDPGVRFGPPGAGQAIQGLSLTQLSFFQMGKNSLESKESVVEGLGPRMNLDSCIGCHSYPAAGGSSPFTNPQIAFATEYGASNSIPPFISLNGAVREARFIKYPDGSPDGGVRALFTIAGRSDAPGCGIAQPDFATEFTRNNIALRIPTPLFGAGLLEQIPDSSILANQAVDTFQKKALGIRGQANFVRFQAAVKPVSGTVNTSANDGTVARFGWKAQNKSLMLFAAEAYNVEMGISNEIFQSERDETPECQFATTPNDTINTDGMTHAEMMGGVEKFAFFMRFLSPPVPSPDMPGGSQSIVHGKTLFISTGCAYCHTTTLYTGNATVAALRGQSVNLYSDLLLHDMGPALEDGISQGQAGPRDFRTAPLWGLGQRIFFLHDGRTSDLIEAIKFHQSGAGRNASEANAVINNFNGLSAKDKQDLLNFLRSL